VLQHTLFARAQPTPEQLSTLGARLGALMGQDRFGAPAVVDTYRPGAFAMTAFATEHKPEARKSEVGSQKSEGVDHAADFRLQTSSFSGVVSALRRCRYPVPARVVVAEGQPVRVTTDRRGFAGGAVTRCAGPWRSSGNWWNTDTHTKSEVGSQKSEGSLKSDGPLTVQTSDFKLQTSGAWNRDEWDVALNDGAVYRIFQDRVTDAWFIDAIVD
jgi:protein ImuB